MSVTNPTPDSAHDASAAAVAVLGAELNATLVHGKLTLPSYPDVAVRVRRVLADDNATPDQLERVLSSEPALAAQLMRLANSAALNPGGRAIREIRTAVARLGFNIVRSATISFAMSQVKNARVLQGLEVQLNAQWRTSTLVAALCYIGAMQVEDINPDEALLAGLLHGVGKLYLLTCLVRYPELQADPAAWQQLEHDWHVPIAGALLEQWEMPGSIVEAVALQQKLLREHEGGADLADVLLVATLVAANASPAVPALKRMGLDGDALQAVLEASHEQVDALQAALGQ